MTVFLDAINQQIDESIYGDQSVDAQYKLASECDAIKRVSIVVAIAAPVFAFFLPTVFGVLTGCGLGLVAYDVFTMADNLGGVARLSAEGGKPSPAKSNMKMLFESTFLAKYLLRLTEA